MGLIDDDDGLQSADQFERRKNMQALELGVEVERFIDGAVGQYLLDRAAQQQEDALDALASVDPEDPKAIRSLQAKYQIALSFGEWLRDAVIDARNAHERLQQTGE